MIEYLDLEDALALVQDLGVGPMRDIGLLDSALHRPKVSVFGEDAYPSLVGKAAVLLESIVRNHALVDGNKRLGWLATMVFLGLNGVALDAPDDDAYEMVVGLAAGTLSHHEAAELLGLWV
ncbi:MAG: type II toxin-antitoxin system death-on-curing family toxin [Arachnia sp.]